MTVQFSSAPFVFEHMYLNLVLKKQMSHYMVWLPFLESQISVSEAGIVCQAAKKHSEMSVRLPYKSMKSRSNIRSRVWSQGSRPTTFDFFFLLTELIYLIRINSCSLNILPLYRRTGRQYQKKKRH